MGENNIVEAVDRSGVVLDSDGNIITARDAEGNVVLTDGEGSAVVVTDDGSAVAILPEGTIILGHGKATSSRSGATDSEGNTITIVASRPPPPRNQRTTLSSPMGTWGRERHRTGHRRKHT